MRKSLLRISTLALVTLFMMMVAGSVMAQSDPMVMNMSPNKTATDQQGVPLGAAPTDPSNTSGSSNLDLQISGNTNTSSSSSGGGGMDKMEMTGMDMGGMMGMMDKMGMGGMGNMNNTNNSNNMSNMNGGQMNGANPMVLSQLQASNMMIMQMLTSLSSQPNGSNQAQIQALYQILANQNALIQMMYSNSMNMGQNNSSNNSSGGSMSGGMGMM